MYWHNLCVAFDQFANSILGGYPDETLSSRSYRQRNKNKFWRFMMNLINALFFDKNHCAEAYRLEIDLPKDEYTDSWDQKY